MTNKEKFVETFGEASYSNLVDVAKEANAIDIFVWLLKEYKEPDRQIAEFELAAKEVMDGVKKDAENLADETFEQPKKRRYNGSRPGRGYDLKWYIDAVSDFYLGQAKSIEFKLSDDLSSGKKVNSLDGYISRWKLAIKELGLEDSVLAHKYYGGTCNECVCLEKPNLRNSKAAGYSNMR